MQAEIEESLQRMQSQKVAEAAIVTEELLCMVIFAFSNVYCTNAHFVSRQGVIGHVVLSTTGTLLRSTCSVRA